MTKLMLVRSTVLPSGAALGLAAHCYTDLHFQGWSRGADDAAEGLRLAWRAVEHARDDANVLWMAAFAVYTLAQDFPRAKELCYRSLQANPNSAMAMTGAVEFGTGNAAKAFELIERARRLSPRDPRDWFMFTALAGVCTFEGRYSEAVVWAEKALIQNRRFAPALRQLAFALVMTGQKERAHDIVQEVLKIEPGLSIPRLRLRVPFGGDPSNPYWQKLSEALRSAGLPD